MKDSLTRTIAGSLITLCLLTGAAAWAQDTEEAAEPARDEAAKTKVTVVERGAEPRAALHFRPEQGATSKTEMRVAMNMTQSMQGMQRPAMPMPELLMLFGTTVQEVEEDGDFTILATYEKAEAKGREGVNPMIVQQMNSAFQTLVGRQFRMTSSKLGEREKGEFAQPVDPMVQQQLTEITGMLQRIGVQVPEEAIGVGAKWTAKTIIENQGMKVDQTATYTLKSVENDTFVVDVEVAQSADEQDIDNPTLPPGAMRLVAFKGTGVGTVTSHRSEALPASARMKYDTEMKMSVTMGQQRQEIEQNMEMTVQVNEVKVEEPTEEEDTEE